MFWRSELTPIQKNIDEKGVHFNEAGSVDLETLALAGSEAVELVENRSAARERFSIMTKTNSRWVARCLLPLQVLFKGNTEHTVKGVAAPEKRFSVNSVENKF